MEQDRIRYTRSADGVELAWTVSGSGPRTLVLAPNHITDIKRDWQDPLRRDLLRRLSAHFRVVRYDHRGCGSSQRNVERQGQAAWLEDLEAVLAEAAPGEPIILMGVSQSGPVAAAYAAHHPAQVSHLILYGAAVCGAKASGIPDIVARDAATIELMRLGWGGAFPGPRGLFMAGLVLDATPEEAAWGEKHLPLAAHVEDAVRFAQADSESDVRGLLAQVKASTLVLHTAEDTGCLPEWGRMLAAGIPGANYVELPGRNHILLARDPGFEPFFTHMLRFIAETQVAPGPLSGLSARERDILEGVCAGLSNEAIALTREISVKTVRNHLSVIFDKLGVNSRTQAAMLATRSQRATAA